MLNKKAEIGETMTWVIATIIIIIVLLIFLYVSSSFGIIKSLTIKTSKIANSLLSDTELSAIEWINAKSEKALKINNNNENKINQWVENE